MTRMDRNRGTLGIGDDGAFRICFDREFAVVPTRMWEWLTEPELLDKWLPGCRIEARVGGSVFFDFGDEGAATGTVLESSIHELRGLLAHSWCWDGVPDSRVVWDLRAHGGGTRLTLTHCEVLPGPASDFAIGWHVMLDALALALAGESVEGAWVATEAIATLYAR